MESLKCVIKRKKGDESGEAELTRACTLGAQI